MMRAGLATLLTIALTAGALAAPRPRPSELDALDRELQTLQAKQSFFAAAKVARKALAVQRTLTDADSTAVLDRTRQLAWLLKVSGYRGRDRMMSLWQVDDAATRDLMAGDGSRLAAGAATSTALRETQLQILGITKYAHPYYWASFLTAGDNSPIQ